MANGILELRREIIQFLSSMRHSVDRPLRVSENETRERYTEMMLLVEEARIRFNSHFRQPKPPEQIEWEIARKDLLSFVDRFMNSHAVDPEIYMQEFRLTSMAGIERGRMLPFIRTLRMKSKKRIGIGEALIAFRSFLTDLEVAQNPVQVNLDFGDLEKIVPRQQVAPIQFEVKNSKLRISRRVPKQLTKDRSNIESAIDHIRGSGEKLIEELKNSNCDKRLLESITELQTQLTLNGNIVKIGLTNMACSVMGSQFYDELPDAVTAMFNSYNASVSLYVAQFPEWEQFTQKAAQIQLSDDDVREVYAATGELVEVLSNEVDLADPEVPKTIAFVRQFLTFPGVTAKRAAFAMVRTIENLVSSILRYALDLLDKTAAKTVEALSSAVSKGVVGLLAIALLGASGIGSAAIQAGAPWVRQAVEIVQKQIDKASK